MRVKFFVERKVPVKHLQQMIFLQHRQRAGVARFNAVRVRDTVVPTRNELPILG